jgi:hypothetical protein
MTEETEVTEAVEAPEVVEELSTEERARAQGWRPPEEYKGAGKVLSAEDYLKKADTEMPVLRDQLRKLERTTLEQKQALETFKAHHERTVESARRQALQDIEVQKMRAVESGDVQSYQALSKQAESVSKVYEQPKVNQPPREVEEFAERNPWLTTDDAMSLEAQSIHLRLQKEKPHLNLSENLAEVERIIKNERYPEKFGRTKAQPSVAMTSAGSGTPRQATRNRYSVSDLDDNSRNDLRKLQKQGLFKGAEGEQKFLKDIFGG